MCAYPNCFHDGLGALDRDCVALAVAGGGSIMIDDCKSRKAWTLMIAILQQERKPHCIQERIFDAHRVGLPVFGRLQNLNP